MPFLQQETDQPVYLTLRQSAECPDLDELGVPQEARRAFYIAMGSYRVSKDGGLF